MSNGTTHTHTPNLRTTESSWDEEAGSVDAISCSRACFFAGGGTTSAKAFTGTDSIILDAIRQCPLGLLPSTPTICQKWGSPWFIECTYTEIALLTETLFLSFLPGLGKWRTGSISVSPGGHIAHWSAQRCHGYSMRNNNSLWYQRDHSKQTSTMEGRHNWITNALHLTAPCDHKLNKSELNYFSNYSFIVERQHVLTSCQREYW